MTVGRLNGCEWQISHDFLSLQLRDLHCFLVSQMRKVDRHLPAFLSVE
jgi:hypothetical protein